MCRREIETVWSGVRPAGHNEVTWKRGRLADGTYFYRLDADGVSEARKLILRRTPPLYRAT